MRTKIENLGNERKEEMKNNLFKKVSAAALAAVMAVTFAPTASLSVFAAKGDVGVDSKNVMTNGSITIQNNGTYTVSGGATGITEITVSGSATEVTIDLSGIDEKNQVTELKTNQFTSDRVNITVKGRVEATRGGDITEWDKIKIDKTYLTTFGSIKFVGDLEVQETGNVLDSKKNGKLSKAFDSSTPVATVGDDDSTDGAGVNYYVGSKLIGQKVADKESIWAINGPVKAEGLADGAFAKISKRANAGTTLTATAADDLSLTKVETRYTYNFEYDSNKDKNPDTEGTSVYTDTMFMAGNQGVAKLLNESDIVDKTGAVNEDVAINTKSLAVDGKVTAIPDYQRAVTLTQNAKNKFAKSLHIGYADAATYTTDDTKAWKHTGAAGITYFTQDPTDLVDSFDGIALIDGTKYVIDREGITTNAADKKPYGQLEIASMHAAKTLKVVKGTTTSGNAVDDNNKIHTKKDVDVSGPKTSTVVLGGYNTIGTKSNNWNGIGFVYGANHVEGVNDLKGFLGNDSAEWGNAKVDSYLNVPQVADGVYAVVNDAFTDTKVTVGTGITYFYEQKTSQISRDGASFVFGKTDLAMKALKSVLSGDAIDGTTYFTKAKPGETVYAAKDLKGTFKNVNNAVTVKGEISSVENADGSWTVNMGYASNAVTAYRMYRKSGEHVYTINPDEVTMLTNAGWINEGPAFTVNSVASKTGTPIYRLYNRNGGGMHFYTANAAEKDMLLANGWTEGKVVFYGADKATGIPVYRTYNTGSNNGEHNYTTNIAESDMNVKAGWRAEGVAFYVFK